LARRFKENDNCKPANDALHRIANAQHRAVEKCSQKIVGGGGAGGSPVSGFRLVSETSYLSTQTRARECLISKNRKPAETGNIAL
jgi:hypothetical protein